MNPNGTFLATPIPALRRNKPWRARLFALTLAAGFAALSHAATTPPDALLAIDMQRSAVVEKIVATWGKELPEAQRTSFSKTLTALRADHLLAASMSGSFDGVLEVLGAAKQSGVSAHSPALGSAQGYFASRALAETAIPAAQNEANLSKLSEKSKALGDANADLVYTPLTPCRLFDTRSGLASALGTVGGTFSQQQTKTIVPNGACGIPTSGVASLFFSFHAFNNNPAALGVIGFMKPTTPFTALAATWTGDAWVTGTFIANTNPNGSFDAFVGNNVPMTADLIVDVVGYFRAPQSGVGGGSGTITAVQTAAGSGLTGGVFSAWQTLRWPIRLSSRKAAPINKCPSSTPRLVCGNAKTICWAQARAAAAQSLAWPLAQA